MENKTFHTEQGFIVDSQELARLAELSKEFGDTDDLNIALEIAQNIPIGAFADDYKWNYAVQLATVYNVGYILGKRAERKRRAKAVRI